MNPVQHYCDANHCRNTVDPTKGVCPLHWQMIPPQLQARIYGVARKFKTRAQRLSSIEFLETWAEAIEVIARAEGHAQRNVFRGLAEAVKRRHLGAASSECEGKKAYDTFTQAEQAMRATLRHDDASRSQMRVYRCRHCPKFHFGHQGPMLAKRA